MSTHLSAEYVDRSPHGSAGLTDKHSNVRGVLGAADVICGVSILLADALAFVASFLFAEFILLNLHPVAGSLPFPAILSSTLHHTVALRCGLLFIVVICYLAGHGHFRDRLSFWNEMREVVLISTLAIIANLGLTVLAGDGVQAYLLSICWVVLPLLVMTLRQAAKHLLSAAGLWEIPVIIVGDQHSVADAVQLLNLEMVPGYRVVGSLHPSLIVDSSFGDRCTSTLKQLGGRRLILSCDFRTDVDYAVMQSVVRRRVPFSLLPQPMELPVVGCTRIPFFSHDTVMLTYRDNLAQVGPRGIKLAFDLLVSALVLAMCSPMFLAAGVLIRRDGGRVFFGHKRVGTGAKAFSCFKFRTMVSNSADVLRDLLERDPAAKAEWEDTQKLTNDPRITSIGKLLRATSLDELPQLLNILRRDMSLVGPRPIVEQEIARYGENIVYYYETKPGLTGLWQVSGRSDTSYVQRVQLDCWYVRNWSMWHDVAILTKTIPAVLLRKGAR